MRNIFLVVTICFLGNIQAQVINVKDYGVVPNSFKDATEGVQQAINTFQNKPNSVLTFPKGRYDFWPDKAAKRIYFISNTSSENECPSKIKNIGLLFENIQNLTIEGNNSLFVFHGKMITWAFNHCENIQFRNVTIDFERPTMSELTFSDVSSEVIVATVHPDSKYDIINNKLYFYGNNWTMQNYFSVLTDTIERTAIYSSFNPLQESCVKEIEPNILKFEGNFSNTNYSAGKTLTIRDPNRDQVGAFINLSKNICLKNITIHYMHGLGIVSQFSENLSYSDIKIIPSRKRTIAGFADGMHFSGCKGDILVENCHFNGLHDDPINVHGTYLQITKIHSPTSVTVRFMHNQTYGFKGFYENDTVAFIRSNMLQTIGENIVKSVLQVSEREMQIDFFKTLPAEINIGDCLENLTWTPSLTVKNCHFEMTNTRGLLVTTPKKVLIENNHFYRTGMYAIQIAGDAESWYESGAVRDVIIRNNLFEECGYNRGATDSYTIAINPEDHKTLKGHWVHRNIHISQNTFKVFDNLVMKARSTNSIIFENNIVEHSHWIPPLRNSKLKITYTSPFKFENCTNIVVQQYQWSFHTLYHILCDKMEQKDIKLEKGIKVKFIE